jgi:hypothetical protein
LTNHIVVLASTGSDEPTVGLTAGGAFGTLRFVARKSGVQYPGAIYHVMNYEYFLIMKRKCVDFRYPIQASIIALLMAEMLCLAASAPDGQDLQKGKTRASSSPAKTDFIELKLPLGQVFETWEIEFHPKKIYHVAQNAPNASDENEGSQNAPFKSISKAAAVLVAGEAVEVHQGVYREWVKPENGGKSPSEMIGYYAAKDEDVVIKGSDEWRPQWVKTRYIGNGQNKNFVTYEATLKGSQFEGANPFCLLNGRIDSDWGYNKEFELCRGMIFLEGQKLRQVSKYELLQTMNPQDLGLF